MSWNLPVFGDLKSAGNLAQAKDLAFVVKDLPKAANLAQAKDLPPIGFLPSF